MPLNVTYPTSVSVGFFISLGWSNTYDDSYFIIIKQLNDSITWTSTSFPAGSDATRYSEQAEATWERVRYRVSGFPSGTVVTTDWISIIGDVDPDPILSTPTILVPQSVAPDTSFEISWSDSNVDATYELEEEVNNGSWQSLNTTLTSKIYYRIALSSWDNVRYRVRAKKGSQITEWAYSLMISIIGGVDPDPDPPLSVPTILTPQSVTPNISFDINWTDTNGTTAEYDIEESVNGGTYQRIASSWSSKSYSRTPSSSWDVVKYRVRAIRNLETTAWAYSADISVEATFPQLSVKVGSEVRNAVDGWVMVDGTLRKITDMWVMVNGALKKS